MLYYFTMGRRFDSPKRKQLPASRCRKSNGGRNANGGDKRRRNNDDLPPTVQDKPSTSSDPSSRRMVVVQTGHSLVRRSKCAVLGEIHDRDNFRDTTDAQAIILPLKHKVWWRVQKIHTYSKDISFIRDIIGDCDPILNHNPDMVLVDLGSNELANCLDGYDIGKIFVIANLLRQLSALLYPSICVFMQILPRRRYMSCTPENFDHYATIFNNFLGQWHHEALSGCFPDNFRFYRMQGWWTKKDDIPGADIPCPTSDWMKTDGIHVTTDAMAVKHSRNIKKAILDNDTYPRSSAQ